MPAKFIHYTDTHLVSPGSSLKGLNPADRYSPCIDSINLHHVDAELCIITGDLTDKSEPEAYEHLRAEINRCAVPTLMIIGNHDDRSLFHEYFPGIQLDDHGFVQYSVKTSFGVFILLDTVKTGLHSGEYCELRREWLKNELQQYKEQPVYLFMHHPPFDIHMPCLDSIGLKDQSLFAEVVKPYKNIRHLFFGHAHRPLSGSWLGIPFSSLRGTNHQVALDFDTDQILYVDEPAEYSIVFVDDDSVVVHTHSY